MHPIAGSERKPVHGARAVREADPQERVEATVVLRRRSSPKKKRMTHHEFASQCCADAKDLEAIRAFAAAEGLQILGEHPERHIVRLAGTVQQFNKAFNVALRIFEHAAGSYRGRTGSVHVPQNLREIVTAVLGLDNRPQARTHFRVAVSPATTYSPVQVASLYDYPTSSNGQGQCIGIIELGGGYAESDLQTYFSGLGLKVPEIVAVPVDGAQNSPTGQVDGPDGEVMLDIEVAGAIAQGAKIAVYFAPNTDAGFLDAITTAVHDTTNKPSVVSISWGGPESSWTSQAMTSMDSAFQDAGTLGITVCCSSGDSGSSDGASSGNQVDFPSSSPHVLGCGGTSLQSAGGKITSETVWNDGASGGATGGGVSTVFALPAWQQKLSVTENGTAAPLQMRGVPDVAGNADPNTGYNVRVDGQDAVFGGTSAVAPLWSALIAIANASRSSTVGFVNAQIYGDETDFNDITSGNNGSFSAAKGWDACTGLGSPNGSKIESVL